MISSVIKSLALDVLDRSQHRGHDLWRDLRFYYKRMEIVGAPVLFDVGANVGQTALAMAKAFPQAQVLSFEPVAATFEELTYNVRMLPQIMPIRKALGSVEGVRMIQSQEHSTVNSLLRPITDESRSESIEVTTVDGIAENRSIKRIFVLKTDTEGFDVNVLQGAACLLKARRIDYVLTEVRFFREMYLPQTRFEDVSLLLSGYDYHLCHIYETVYATGGGSILWCNALFTAH